MTNCKDGSHAVELIEESAAAGRAWIAVVDEPDGGVTYCAAGNHASYGRFFQEIGKMVEEFGYTEPLSCAVCSAHRAAVRAGLEAFNRVLNERGVSHEGKCQ